jgi:hypothetical protein
MLDDPCAKVIVKDGAVLTKAGGTGNVPKAVICAMKGEGERKCFAKMMVKVRRS